MIFMFWAILNLIKLIIFIIIIIITFFLILENIKNKRERSDMNIELY